ncbi:MAG: hypothetical protein KA240_00595 [Nitrospira sp.]|nr:hypothetical protein [Nitrospira sp.]MBP6604148.1 hypothetical protein [Nitrospira sp.]HQY58185.1 hypothetical protein [Nitrospira sp.]HRA96426.1 hypothetical protein [Nitrospira sp.]
MTAHTRSRDQTFLTLPEWYIVYSADEFGRFVQTHSPSDFPYFKSIRQFWCLYRQVLRETWNAPSFNWGYHVMIGVIGSSFTAEYLLKGTYERTIGALTTWWDSEGPWQARTREDRFMQTVAKDYSTFIHTTPWYEYPFWSKLQHLWSLTGPVEGSVVRRWERRLEGTIELLVKAAWGCTIGFGTQAGYDPETMEIQAWVEQGAEDLTKMTPALKVVSDLGDHSYLVSLPRYEPFTQAVQTLIRRDARLVEVAGNAEILMTIIAPQEWQDLHHLGLPVCEWTILTEPERKRVALLVPIGRLHETLPALERDGLIIDHLYDF